MTSQAYLGPVRDHPGLRVVSSARVHRVLVAGGRCVGVEWDRAGVVERATADQVVLAAGALGTPQVLQRSGIGDPAQLRPLGIPVTVALRGRSGATCRTTGSYRLSETSGPIPLPTGLPVTQSHLFWRSRPGLAVPDLQPIHFATPLVAPWMTPPPHGISLMAGLVRPASRGTVRIASADPSAAPLIDPRVLSAPEDLSGLVAAVELCQAIAAEPALRDAWAAREIYPGSLGRSAESMRDYIRETVVTYHHQSGTCAMGRHEDAVVDARLRVHGLGGLTVADASVMPTVTTGNTNAPAAMIGERAAHFILNPV
jgi:choline dehydrogenase